MQKTSENNIFLFPEGIKRELWSKIRVHWFEMGQK